MTEAGVLFNGAIALWSALLHTQKVQGRHMGTGINRAQQVNRNVMWTPPPFSTKINCDASVSLDGEGVGVGAIIRNEVGELVGADGQRLGRRLSLLAAELFAIKHALEMAVERRLRSVVIETDCMEAVYMINSAEICLAAEGVVVDQIRSLLRFLHISGINYIPREANVAAHSVASFVARDNGRH